MVIIYQEQGNKFHSILFFKLEMWAIRSELNVRELIFTVFLLFSHEKWVALDHQHYLRAK